MIYSNLDNLADYPFLPSAIQACFSYAASHDLSTLSAGRHEVDGDRIYVNILEYTTASEENRIWEAHQKYLDLHLMVQGQEYVALNHIQQMRLGEFQEARDFLPMEGDAACHLCLRPRDFLICYPTDGHKTGICVTEPSKIKKAIFKIAIA